MKKIKIFQKVTLSLSEFNILGSLLIYSKASVITNCVVENNSYIMENDEEVWSGKFQF